MQQPGTNKYWVVTTATEMPHSKRPMPLNRAKAQMRALYSATKDELLHGSGPRPDKAILQQMGQQSYRPAAPDGSSSIGDFDLIRSTPTLKLYVDAKDKTVIVAIRGTKDSTDVAADLRIAAGTLEHSTRFKNDLKTLTSWMAEYPPADGWDWYGVGHSLGGAILDLFLEKGLLKSGLSYNPAVQPQHLTATDLPNDRIFTETDLLGKLARPFLTRTPELRAAKTDILGSLLNWVPGVGTAYNALQGHRLNQFEGGQHKKTTPRSSVMEPSKSELLATKSYPENYPDDAVTILNAMSFGPNLKLLGSMSMKAQQYAGDYDGFEVVNMKGSMQTVLTALRKKMQDNVRKLLKMDNCYINDIKSGCVDAWRIIPRDVRILDDEVENWTPEVYKQSMERLHSMLKENIITSEEAKKAEAVLHPHMKPVDFFAARDACKFHILRWKPKDILENSLETRDGSHITLETAFHMPCITKMDVIGWIQNNRYTDFSVIFEFHCGKTILNPDPIDIVPSLQADIDYYTLKGKYFKAMKRTFALAKFKGEMGIIERLTPLLNSDLGRLYHVMGDIGTLRSLLNHPRTRIEDIRTEVDQFIGRLSSIFAIPEFTRKEPDILAEVRRILTLPKASLEPELEKLEDTLAEILNHTTKSVLDKMR